MHVAHVKKKPIGILRYLYNPLHKCCWLNIRYHCRASCTSFLCLITHNFCSSFLKGQASEGSFQGKGCIQAEGCKQICVSLSDSSALLRLTAFSFFSFVDSEAEEEEDDDDDQTKDDDVVEDSDFKDDGSEAEENNIIDSEEERKMVERLMAYVSRSFTLIHDLLCLLLDFSASRKKKADKSKGKQAVTPKTIKTYVFFAFAIMTMNAKLVEASRRRRYQKGSVQCASKQ